MPMPMSDEEAFIYYSDLEHQEPVGPARRRSRPGMTSHVPVRFHPDIIAKVKILAARDRKTVSAWIRNLVEREIERRLPAPRSEAVQWPLRLLTPLPTGPVTETSPTPEDSRSNLGGR
jgi:hypothetical protein